MTYYAFHEPETEQSYGSFETFYITSQMAFEMDLERGWYWASGFPGCLRDSEPIGPFETETEAIEDANYG